MKEKKFLEKLEQAKEIHGDKYTYEHVVNPKTVKDYIYVTCPKHGDFKTTFDTLVNKKGGCPKCKGVHRRTQEEAVAELQEIHKNKNYDFSEVVFKSVNDKVTVICHEKDILGREHGRFQMRFSHLLNGHGCPKCAKRYLTTEEVIANAKRIHGDKYDYSLIEYHNDNSERLPIICHVKDENGVEHGIFKPVWSSHIAGCGCPKCNGGVAFNKEIFVNNANKVHNGYYTYDNFKYINANTKGFITCPRHGDFLQSPYEHVNMRHGCPKCKSSRLETLVRYHLQKNDLFFEEQVLIGLGRQTVDFYLPKYKMYIECQGEQHFIPTDFSNDGSTDINKEFEKRCKNDFDKYEACTKDDNLLIYFCLPNDFHVADVDVHKGFYSDKNVFTNIDDLIRFILKKTVTNDECTSELCKFIREVGSIAPNITVSNGRLKLGNNVIYFNQLNEKNSKNIYDRHRTGLRRGYRVLDIFEDEYVCHHDIVMSKVRHILGFDENVRKINGRQCNVVGISHEIADDFLDKNHIQGSVKSSIYYGCFYNNELVAVMNFLKEGDGKWNLTRYATLIGTLCRGTASKMFKKFVKDYNPVEVKSFADRRWTPTSENNLYVKLGFTYTPNDNGPEYRYFKKGETEERKHKFGFRKQILHKKYGLPLTMTENEMTKALGYDKIWDCGLFKYVWINPENEKTSTAISETVEV